MGGQQITLAAFTSLQALSRPKPCWWLWLKPAWFVSHLAWRSSYCKDTTKGCSGYVGGHQQLGTHRAEGKEAQTHPTVVGKQTHMALLEKNRLIFV